MSARRTSCNCSAPYRVKTCRLCSSIKLQAKPDQTRLLHVAGSSIDTLPGKSRQQDQLFLRKLQCCACLQIKQKLNSYALDRAGLRQRALIARDAPSFPPRRACGKEPPIVGGAPSRRCFFKQSHTDATASQGSLHPAYRRAFNKRPYNPFCQAQCRCCARWRK